MAVSHLRHAPASDAGQISETAFFERVLFENGREWVCRNAIGDVLEVAIGAGRNLPFYPPHVRLTGIEFSPAMLEIARQRAASLDRPVDLRRGDAQALDLPDAAFDTVICTLSLCAIPNEGRAIAEMKRVLRPGGRLVLLDHVIASPAWGAGYAVGTRACDGSTRRRALAAASLVTAQIEGFVVETSQRSKLGIERVLAHRPVEVRQSNGGTH